MARIKRVSRRLMVLSSAAAGGLAGLFGSSMPQAKATAYYWDTTTTGLWASATNWSTSSTGSPGGGGVPGIMDTATFNGSAVNGAETVQLGAATSVAGITFANTGTTTIESSNSTSRTLTIESGGITINNGAGAVTIGDTTDLAPITLGANQSWTNNSAALFTAVNTLANGGFLLTIAGSGSTTLSGVIGGTGGLTMSGSGVLTLGSAANTYTGATTISGGTVAFTGAVASNVNSAFGKATSTIAVSGGGVLSFSDPTAARTFARTITIGTGGAEVDNTGAFLLTQSGAITGTDNLVLKANSTGGITLSTAPNNTGAITNSGTGIGTTTITGILSAVTAITENSGTSALTISGSGNVITVNSGGTTLTNNGGAILSAGTVGNSGGITGTGNLTLNNNSATADGITLTGTSTINYTGTLTNSGTGTGSTLIGTLIGSHVTELIQNSATSTLILTAANNSAFLSGIAIQAGTIQVGSATALGSSPNTVTVSSGGALDVAGITMTATNPLTLNGTGITNTGSLTNSTGSGTYAGTITLASASTIGSTGTLLTITGAIGGTGNLTVNANSGGITLAAINNAGSITNSGTGAGTTTISGVIGTHVTGVTQSSSTSLLLLSGANTYTGPTAVTAGTLQAGVASVAGVSGAFGNNSAVTLSNVAGVTLDLNSFNTRIGSLDGGGATGGNVTLGSATLTLGGTGISSSFAGVISGTGALAMNAAGTETLTGSNTYTGTTTVNSGILQIAGTAGTLSGTTAVVVSGGTLIDGDSTAANNDGVTDRINNTSPLTLGGTGGTSTFTLAAASSSSHLQTFASLTVASGFPDVINTTAATGTNTLTFTGTGGAGYVQTLGGEVDIDTQTGFTVVFTNAPTAAGGSSVSGTGTDAILIGATLNGADFILAAAGAVGPANYTVTGTNIWTAGKNMDVTGTVSPAKAGVAVNSVRFNQTAADTVNLTSTSNIASGDILVTSNVGANTSTITGGTITGSASGELMVIQNNTAGGLTITSVIADNGGPTGLTKVGAGLLNLGGTLNSYTGVTTILGGTVAFSGNLNTKANTALGHVGETGNNNATIAISGGAILRLSSGNSQIGRNITIGSGGAELDVAGAGTLTDVGAITGTGNLVLKANSSGGFSLTGGINNTGNITNSGSGNGTTSIDGIGTLVTSLIQDSTTGSQLNINTANISGDAFTTVIKAGALVNSVGSGNANSGLGTGSITIGDSSGSADASLLVGSNGKTYSNAITIAAGSSMNTLTLGVSGGAAAAAFIFSGGITLNNNLTVTTGSSNAALTESGTVTGTGNLTLNAASGAITFSNTVNNTGSITNSGTGTSTSTVSGAIGTLVTGVIQNSATSSLVLGGVNTYTHATAVNSGILVVNGSLASGSAVGVADGAILSGTGNGTSTGLINGPVTLASGTSGPGSAGGTISPGSGNTSSSTVGKLTLANSTNTFGTAGGATQVTYDWKVADFGATTSGTVGTAGTDFDTLAVTGLSITGSGTGGVDVVASPLSSPAFTATGFNSANTYTWDILSGTEANGTTPVGGLAAQFHLDASGLHGFETALGLTPGTSDSSFSIIDDSGDIAVQYQYTAAPEPTSMMLLGLGVGGMVLRRRRRGMAAMREN